VGGTIFLSYRPIQSTYS